ncbi:MAG: hypothetical protein SPL13_03025 [Clostridia bacterium]|nr:hypothetical protein [Clostridia bacterium]
MFRTKIADVAFGVEPIYETTARYFKDYPCEDTEELAFVARVSKSSIDELLKEIPDCRPDYAESLEVFRILSYYLLNNRLGTMIHASAIAVDGEAYLFTALSGTGKSTHARLWRELLGSRAVMVNDDKPILRLIGDEIYVYGTPWMGKHYLGANIKAKVKAVCKIEQAPENSIEDITVPEMVLALFNQTVRPLNEKDMMDLTFILDKLLRGVKTYRLKCTPTIDAAKLSFSVMSGEKL